MDKIDFNEAVSALTAGCVTTQIAEWMGEPESSVVLSPAMQQALVQFDVALGMLIPDLIVDPGAHAWLAEQPGFSRAVVAVDALYDDRFERYHALRALLQPPDTPAAELPEQLVADGLQRSASW